MSFDTDAPRPNGDDSDNDLLYKIAIRLWRLVVAGTESLTTKASATAAAATLTNTAAAASNVVITRAGVAGSSHVIYGLTWSYAGAADLPSPAAPGRLTITDGGTVVFDIDITNAGPGPIPINLKGTSGAAMVVTLYSGGTGVIGKLNINARTE